MCTGVSRLVGCYPPSLKCVSGPVAVLQLPRALETSPRPRLGWKGCNGVWDNAFTPNRVVSHWFPVPQWAGSPLMAAPLSLQVLTTLLMLTAVAELVLAVVEGAQQDPLPAVQYTNPSLYIATWVRDQPVNVLCQGVRSQGQAAEHFSSTEISRKMCPRGRCKPGKWVGTSPELVWVVHEGNRLRAGVCLYGAPPFILKTDMDTVPVRAAEISGRSLGSSSVGLTGLIAQRERQTTACCSDVSQLPVG